MSIRYTRRAFAAAGLAASGAAILSTNASAQSTRSSVASSAFPPGFRWGTATSSYQVEGAVRAEGRGVSIWDTFCATPGAIRDGSTGELSVDHFHRFREDVALMKGLGAATYRFSIAWPRVFPEGSGRANPKGLDFYDRLVDALLDAGIEPYPTLYHWDLPQTLQDEVGGWRSRDTAEAFGAYAGHVARRLSDRVQNFFTINEMLAFVEHGYGAGIFAPGLKLPPAQLAQVRHHAVLGHGLAVQAIRANARPGTKVGPAENITTAIPVIETPEHIAAAERATREMNAPYLTVMMEGRYTDAFLAEAGADAPKFTAEDLRIISSPVDFVGLNIYVPNFYVKAADNAEGFEVLPMPPSYPRMASPWLKFGPEAIYWAPRHAATLWNIKDIYITENGTSAADQPAQDGIVYDTDRVMYLRNYLTQLQRATSQGVPVRGYFLWSLLDNFEWADGYATRFGLVHVDYATQKRTPKLSASFYKEVIARNALA
jgi:beta-glucosidase